MGDIAASCVTLRVLPSHLRVAVRHAAPFPLAMFTIESMIELLLLGQQWWHAGPQAAMPITRFWLVAWWGVLPWLALRPPISRTDALELDSFIRPFTAAY